MNARGTEAERCGLTGRLGREALRLRLRWTHFCRNNAVEASFPIQLCLCNLKALPELGALALSSHGHALVKVDALDCAGCSCAQLLH